jgi:hypothetical protein
VAGAVVATSRATAVRDILRRGGWSRSSRLQLLDFDVAVHSDDPIVVEVVDALYAPLAAPGEAEHVLALGEAEVDGRPGYSLTLDGVLISRTTAPSIVFSDLLFTANQEVIERTSGVLLHAAAAVVDGAAVVLPGAMRAGKSTLATGLVARGCGYLTDEVVAFDDGAGAPTVRSYPKPISLDARREVLVDQRWEPPSRARDYFADRGALPARALRADAVAEPAPLGLVVLPEYLPGSPTALLRLEPAEALVAVAAHTFRLEEPGRLAALAAVLDGVPCFRMAVGDLDDAVTTILELRARTREDGAR